MRLVTLGSLLLMGCADRAPPPLWPTPPPPTLAEPIGVVEPEGGWGSREADPQQDDEPAVAPASVDDGAGQAGEAEDADPEIARGRALATTRGCLACHSLDGREGVGPTWKGAWGTERALADGTRVLLEGREGEAYLRRAMIEPGVEVVPGFPGAAMPSYADVLDEVELRALVRFIQALGGGASAPAASETPEP